MIELILYSAATFYIDGEKIRILSLGLGIIAQMQRNRLQPGDRVDILTFSLDLYLDIIKVCLLLTLQ